MFKKFKLKRDRRTVVGLIILHILMFSAIGFVRSIYTMPGVSYQGELPPLSEVETAIAQQLETDVLTLAEEIGHRNVENPENYNRAVAFLSHSLERIGYEVQTQSFLADGVECHNIEAEKLGLTKQDEILIIGAHYDTVIGTRGANDNGSGVAATLALARAFADSESDRTIRFVLFANEEPPYFQTELMGSLVYARDCRSALENIIGMFSLETMGYFSDEPGSQQYPAPLNYAYPDTGNFIAFVGNRASSRFVKNVVSLFREHATFPSEGGAFPSMLTGVGWSDHWSFWQESYPAIMVTDTAPFRYPYYHHAKDTPDKIDYEKLARIVTGLHKVIEKLANL